MKGEEIAGAGCEEEITAFVECMKSHPDLYGLDKNEGEPQEGEEEGGSFPEIKQEDDEFDSKITRRRDSKSEDTDTKTNDKSR